MSADLPDSLDAWRAVTARRVFDGTAALSSFSRLRDSLADTEGTCRYRLVFGLDELDHPMVEVEADTELPLVCQRSLERFLLRVSVRQRLGLLRREEDETMLPPGVEPVLVGADGKLAPLDLIEDELILALPVVPLAPDTGALTPDTAPARTQDRDNPFAALAALKKPPT
ncbi:MAG: hypothetical protein KatS3mg126_1837 [Lysobacteraceae bacterium]|nr:MAG: hypothetical protein KatS3mg126_1837 [Xanthomonadaceae bacterium]